MADDIEVWNDWTLLGYQYIVNELQVFYSVSDENSSLLRNFTHPGTPIMMLFGNVSHTFTETLIGPLKERMWYGFKVAGYTRKGSGLMSQVLCVMTKESGILLNYH